MINDDLMIREAFSYSKCFHASSNVTVTNTMAHTIIKTKSSRGNAPEGTELNF